MENTWSKSRRESGASTYQCSEACQRFFFCNFFSFFEEISFLWPWVSFLWQHILFSVWKSLFVWNTVHKQSISSFLWQNLFFSLRKYFFVTISFFFVNESLFVWNKNIFFWGGKQYCLIKSCLVWDKTFSFCDKYF